MGSQKKFSRECWATVGAHKGWKWVRTRYLDPNTLGPNILDIRNEFGLHPNMLGSRIPSPSPRHVLIRFILAKFFESILFYLHPSIIFFIKPTKIPIISLFVRKRIIFSFSFKWSYYWSYIWNYIYLKWFIGTLKISSLL